MLRLTEEQIREIKGGHLETLESALKEADGKLINLLKRDKSNTAYLQGASCIVDELLKVFN